MADWPGERSFCGGKRVNFAQDVQSKSLILTRKNPLPYGCLKPWGDMMAEKTLTRMDLSEAVFREVGLSRNESAQLVETVLEHLSDALVRGEQVKISSFGTFSVRDKSARVGRNPKTGEEVPINPRRVLTFRPSHLMKDRVADGNKS